MFLIVGIALHPRVLSTCPVRFRELLTVRTYRFAPTRVPRFILMPVSCSAPPPLFQHSGAPGRLPSLLKALLSLPKRSATTPAAHDATRVLDRIVSGASTARADAAATLHTLDECVDVVTKRLLDEAPRAVDAAAALESAFALVGRCKLKGSEPRVESVWYRRLKLTYDEVLSSVAVHFNLRRYSVAHTLRSAATRLLPNITDPNMMYRGANLITRVSLEVDSYARALQAAAAARPNMHHELAAAAAAEQGDNVRHPWLG